MSEKLENPSNFKNELVLENGRPDEPGGSENAVTRGNPVGNSLNLPFDKLASFLQEQSCRYPRSVISIWLVVTLGLVVGALLTNQGNFHLISSSQFSGPELIEGVIAHLPVSVNTLIILGLLVIILLTSFGTVVAALLGLGAAVTNLLITVSVLLLTRPALSDADIPAGIIIALVGLGTSIDYTLFIVSRFRFKLRASGDSQAAVTLAVSSAGKTNFASAIVWIIALSSLLFFRDQTLTTVALGTLGLILIALLGSITALPATLLLLKDRVNAGRLPYFGNDAGEGTGIWGKVVIVAVRHPRVSALVSFGLLAALCLPLIRIRLGGPQVEQEVLSDFGSFTDNNYHFLNVLLIWGFVAGLSFMVLVVLEHSLILAAKVVLISLLSTGAALGVVVLVFQFGWLKELLGLGKNGNTIEQNLPLLLFPLFFGFSISYQILTLQRVSEKREKGSSTRLAVANGPRVVSGTIVSAGAIMRTAITLMLAVQFSEVQQLGVGLVAGIYLDAVVARCVLGPAILQLLSQTRWEMPRKPSVFKSKL